MAILTTAFRLLVCVLGFVALQVAVIALSDYSRSLPHYSFWSLIGFFLLSVTLIIVREWNLSNMSVKR